MGQKGVKVGQQVESGLPKWVEVVQLGSKSFTGGQRGSIVVERIVRSNVLYDLRGLCANLYMSVQVCAIYSVFS